MEEKGQERTEIEDRREERKGHEQTERHQPFHLSLGCEDAEENLEDRTGMTQAKPAKPARRRRKLNGRREEDETRLTTRIEIGSATIVRTNSVLPPPPCRSRKDGTSIRNCPQHPG